MGNASKKRRSKSRAARPETQVPAARFGQTLYQRSRKRGAASGPHTVAPAVGYGAYPSRCRSATSCASYIAPALGDWLLFAMPNGWTTGDD